MARIYYHEEKLNGQPLKSDAITIDGFEYIVEHGRENRIEIEGPKRRSIFDFLKAKAPFFNNIEIKKDGFYYEANEGRFYLPKAIIFCDDFDYNFPSEFYFIARIGDGLELRKCKGGPEVLWHHMPDLHEAIEEKRFLTKVENTFLLLINLIETSRDKSEDKERYKAEGQITDDLIELESYKMIVEACMENRTKKDQFIKFL